MFSCAFVVLRRCGAASLRKPKRVVGFLFLFGALQHVEHLEAATGFDEFLN